ncbi:hypothetical protein CEXT_570031 [Caerostris extrusa]|uniref:Uncharacterized protein n=1 Tax=Caerostris extrusa TaxID=172846 RepID=A0AAV4XNJ2_CAEEX|nr:hypothetical protein CEXT_570031 [Caerostris extrusa]
MNGREQYHETRRLSEEASVFMAELKAIETAIVYVTSNHFSFCQNYQTPGRSCLNNPILNLTSFRSRRMLELHETSWQTLMPNKQLSKRT